MERKEFKDEKQLKKWLKVAGGAFLILSLSSSVVELHTTITQPLKLAQALEVKLDGQPVQWIGDGPFKVEVEPKGEDDTSDEELEYHQYAVAFTSRCPGPEGSGLVCDNKHFLLEELKDFDVLCRTGPMEESGVQTGHVLVLVPQDPREAEQLAGILERASAAKYLWPDNTGLIHTGNTKPAHGFGNKRSRHYVSIKT